MLRSTLVALTVLAAAAGCGSSAPPAAAPTGSAQGAPAPESKAAPGAASAIPKPVNEAIDRVRAAIGQPDDAHIRATFSPTFLEHVSTTQIHDLFLSIHEHTGDCSKQELVERKTDEQAVVRLVCARGNYLGAVTVNAEPSHLIDGLVLKLEGH